MNNARAVMTPNWMMKTAEIVEKEKMNTFELAMVYSATPATISQLSHLCTA